MSLLSAWVYSNIIGGLAYLFVILALLYGWGLKPVSWPLIIISYLLATNVHFLVWGARAKILDVFMKRKPGKIVQYFHHGALVAVDEKLRRKHRDYCLCYRCALFCPGRKVNCQIANKLFQFCVAENLVTPVWECESFREGNPDLSRLEGKAE